MSEKPQNRRWGPGCCLIAASVVACLISFVIEAILGEEGIYHNQSVDDREYVEKRIKDAPAFSNVTNHNRTDGGAYLTGKVASKEDRDKLLEEVTKAVGEHRARMALSPIQIESAQPLDGGPHDATHKY